jgi:hypothetical protein
LKNLLIQQIRVVREVLAISNNIIGNIIAKTIQSQQYRTSLQSNNMDQNLAILLLCPGLLCNHRPFIATELIAGWLPTNQPTEGILT